MPEGDTIYRSARTLKAALAGRIVTGFRTVLPHLARVNVDTPVAGRTVDDVVSRGKHILMHFSGAEGHGSKRAQARHRLAQMRMCVRTQSARGGWHRQRVQVGSLFCGASVAIWRREFARRGDAAACARHRAATAARQRPWPAHGGADDVDGATSNDRTRTPGAGAMGVWPSWRAVPAVRDADRDGQTRTGRTRDVLLSELPALSGGTKVPPYVPSVRRDRT
jgi:Formamidopyrimidine-DNA glycosylase N-terminal domain